MRWVPRASPHSAPTAAFSYFVLYESPGWVPCSERVDTPIDKRSHCMISREQQKGSHCAGVVEGWVNTTVLQHDDQRKLWVQLTQGDCYLLCETSMIGER